MNLQGRVCQLTGDTYGRIWAVSIEAVLVSLFNTCIGDVALPIRKGKLSGKSRLEVTAFSLWLLRRRYRLLVVFLGSGSCIVVFWHACRNRHGLYFGHKFRKEVENVYATEN